MPAICACRRFPPPTVTKLPGIFRLVPDQVHIASIPLDALPATPPVTAMPANLDPAVIEAQCELLRVSDRTDDFAGCTGAAARVATNALHHAGRPQLADTVAARRRHGVGSARRRTVAGGARTGAVEPRRYTIGRCAEAVDGPGIGAPSATDGRPSACSGSARRKSTRLSI